ncbi:MAG: hypothetical protein GEU99_08395 [Luteitalea sp.]|nr:hypothetical protein [Luteitalea sp.]
MHRFFPLLVASTVVVTALPASSAAQMQTPPPRDYPNSIFGGVARPDQDRLRQELDLTVNLHGGYDDTVRPEGAGVAPVDVRLQDSGYTGSASAGLRYWRGRNDRWFSLQGQGYVNGYSSLDIGPSSGGTFGAQAQTAVGRRGTLTVGQRVSSDPFFSFNSFSPLEPIVGVDGTPESDPTRPGLFGRRSWTTSSSATWAQRLGRRDTARFSYGFSQRQFVDDDRGNNHAHRASASYHRRFGREGGLRVSYQLADSEFADYDELVRPARRHTIEGGPELTKRFSRTRSISFSAGAGAMRVETVSRGEDRAPLEYWVPFGQGAVRIDIARSWALGANYRRGVTLHEGVTSETFVTDSANMTLSGYLTRRVDVALSGGYSVGQPRRTDEGGRQDLKTYVASAQVRFALARHAAIFTEYSYYRYQFADPFGPTVGFPPSFDRNAVRVGLSLWVPLSGRSRGPRQ